MRFFTLRACVKGAVGGTFHTCRPTANPPHARVDSECTRWNLEHVVLAVFTHQNGSNGCLSLVVAQASAICSNRRQIPHDASIHARTRRGEAVVRGLPRSLSACPRQDTRLQHSQGEAAGAGALQARGSRHNSAGGMTAAHPMLTPAADRPWNCHHSPFAFSEPDSGCRSQAQSQHPLLAARPPPCAARARH